MSCLMMWCKKCRSWVEHHRNLKCKVCSEGKLMATDGKGAMNWIDGFCLRYIQKHYELAVHPNGTTVEWKVFDGSVLSDLVKVYIVLKNKSNPKTVQFSATMKSNLGA